MIGNRSATIGESAPLRHVEMGEMEMGSDFVISLFLFCGPRPDSFPTQLVSL